MSKGGGGGNSQVEQRVHYPGWFTDRLLPLLGDLDSVYQSQAGNPLNPQQTDALRGMEEMARGGGSLGGAGVNTLEDLFARGGMARGTGAFARDLMGGQFTNPAMSQASEIAGGEFNNPAMKFARKIAGGQFDNPAMRHVSRVARGADVGNNPYLDAAYGRAAGNMTTAFNESLVPGMDQGFAQSGRLGSGAYAQMRNTAEDQLGQSLGDLATGLYGGAYEGERNRQMQAQSLMGALGQQDIGNRITGAGMMGDLAQQDFGNRIAGTGMLAGLGQQDITNRMAGAGMLDQGTARELQGIGLGGAANAMRYDDLARLYGVGQQMQQAPWSPGTQFMGLLNAPAGLGGSMTTQQPGGNPFAQMIQGGMGGAASGAMLGSMIPGVGAGWGALGFGGLGALAGMF